MFYDFMDSRLNVRRQLLWPQQKKYYCLISCENLYCGGALRTIPRLALPASSVVFFMRQLCDFYANLRNTA